MKTTHVLLAGCALAFVLFSRAGFGQGDLTPPGKPEPSMKSLQEIWDKMSGLESTAAKQQQALQAIQSQNAMLQRQLSLLSIATVNFAWATFTLDSVGQVADYTSLAFGPDGYPAIAYYDITNHALKFIRYDGANWNQTVVDAGNAGSYPSLAFGPDGQPAISYVGALHPKLARFDGATWTSVSVDDAAFVGSYTSMAFGRDGYPAVAYYDLNAGDLKFSRFDGKVWNATFVDTANNVGMHNSLAFGPDGQPAISYYDQTATNLKYAHLVGFQWFTAVVDGASTNTGEYTSLAFGPDGQPAISYRANTPGTHLMLARFNSGVWTSVIVAGNVNPAETSLKFGPDGQPAIAYYTGVAADLIFTRYTGSLDGPTWTATNVDYAGAVGSAASLAFGADGQPAISYRDILNGDLKFARKGVFAPAP